MIRGRNGGTALRCWRFALVLVLAFVLLFQLPYPVGVPAAPTPFPSSGELLTFRTDATPAEIAGAGAQLLETYGAFSVARGTASALSALVSWGWYAAAVPMASFLRLASGDVDVRALAQPEAQSFGTDVRGDKIGIVHFYAPMKDAWRAELEARGVQLLWYLPVDAFVVRGDPSAIEGLRSLRYVDWVGPYASSWKLPTSSPGTSGVQDIRIVVLPGEPPQAVEAWLAHQGVPPRPLVPSGEGIVGAFGSGEMQWVRARVRSDLVPLLASLPEVEYVDPVSTPRSLNSNTAWILQTNATGNTRYWQNGLNGTGQVLGLADTGVDYDNPQFRQSASVIAVGDLYNQTNPARRKVVRYLDMGVLTGSLTWPGGGGPWDPYSMMDCAYNGGENGHGTAVASTLAGNAQGINNGDPNNGNALGAQLYVEDVGGLSPGTTCATSNEGLIYVPEDYANLFGPPGLVYNDPAAPVRIQSNSWGSTGNVYNLQARMVDAFVWGHPDFALFFAAGNEGSNAFTIDSPGTAKDVVTVGGACNPDAAYSQCAGAASAGSQNDLAVASSRGPTRDGRIKPDIVTLFDGFSATSSGSPFDCAVWGSPSCNFLSDHGWAGTSYATPAAAAAAAIVRQYFTQGWYPTRSPVTADGFNPSAALLRSMLLASGVQITGGNAPAATWPNNNQGFGRLLLSNILPLPGDPTDTEVVDNAAGLVTGQATTYTFHVVSGAAPARFVLTWTDYPGTLGAAKALVNDLDLEVTAPDGTVYRGNNFGSFAAGQSAPGGTFDTTNTEEAVLLKTAAPGDWRVRVIAADVPVGPQPFALVAAGALDPGYARLVLDRASYSESDTVRVTVYDANAASVSANVASGLEPAGEAIALSQAALGAPWKGTIRTAFGQPVSDGILEVRNGDTITVTYQDASPAHTATATATVDAWAPAVSGVAANQIQATSAEIRWTSDKAATSEIHYGLAPSSLTRVVDDTTLRTRHSLQLRGLQADTLYYYDVVSTDALGHATRDADGGRHYVFRTPPLGDVLLVIGDDTFPIAREASYAAALDAFGWTWSPWRAADLGLPPLSILQGRRAVVWQVGLEEYPTFNATAQTLVKAYLDGGGRLLIFSHDTSWSLGSTASPWYSAANAGWLRGVLKATFSCDPGDVGQVVGVAGDPVSGAYAAGVMYTPHRSGGADDEIGANNVGGSASVAWRDGQVVGCAGNAPIGLRWVSSANNGTSGTGAWGGTPSRLAYFAFEITSVDTNATDLRPRSAVREQILDNAVRWLVGVSTAALDRDHPNVTIQYPAGGVYAGSAVPINWTATAFGSGVGIASFVLSFSGDGGQTWSPIASLGGGARSFVWNLAGVLNGNAYLVRVAAADSGTPSLTGTATTSRTFTINRTGGDSLGPVIWAGSLRLAPDPPGAAAMAWFNATADDTRSGNGAIAAAELFWSASPPSAANGTGLVMDPKDGGFDAPVENVTWSGPLAIAPGSSCAWVHAEDAAGNWGPFNVTCFLVIYTGPDVLPPAPAVLASVRLVNGGADLRVGWAKAWDDSLYGGTTRYRVWRAASAAGPYAALGADLPATGATSYAIVDPGRGSSDPADSFYRIETFDGANNTRMSPAIATKAWIAVNQGLNLLGMPADPAGLSLGNLTAAAPWSEAWSYDACAGGFGWAKTTPSDGSPFVLRPGRGFWFNGTAAGRILVLGITPERSRLRLCAGWNLVALPGFLTNATVASLKQATGASLVLGFDPTDLYHTRVLPDADLLVPGKGYWVQVPAGVVWRIAGW